MPASPGTFYPTNPTLGQQLQGSVIGARQVGRGYVAHLSLTAAQAALGTATDVLGQTDNSVAIDTTTGFTQPLSPRNITATPAGTTGNVTAVQVIVTGTDESGATITETLPAFSAGAATAKVGNKSFATVTRIQCPINGAAVTIGIGVGAKLGLPHKLANNTIIQAHLNHVKEGTLPTVAVDATNLSGNTAQLNSALNGSAVDLYYFVP